MMCLAIPGLVEETFELDGLLMGRVNFAGVKRATCLQYTPEAASGSYVLVHVGFAISVIDEDEARRSLEALFASGEAPEVFDDQISGERDHEVSG